MAKHKHANLIHKWADGAEIEYYSVLTNSWIAINEPVWDLRTQYRIKQPQWQVDLQQALKRGDQVEYLMDGTWIPIYTLDNEKWSTEDKYRVKPQPVYMWAYLIDGDWYAQSKLMTESQARTELIKTAGVEKIKKLHTFPNP